VAPKKQVSAFKVNGAGQQIFGFVHAFEQSAGDRQNIQGEFGQGNAKSFLEGRHMNRQR
jgi:hypothetical protein